MRLIISVISYQLSVISNQLSVISYQFDHAQTDKTEYLQTEYDVDERSENFSSQLIYSYKINPQTLFYLGYSDSGYQDDDLQKIQRGQRTLFTKFSYAWQL